MQTSEKVKISELTDGQISEWNALSLMAPASARFFSGYFFCHHVDKCQGGVEVIFVRENNELIGLIPVQRDGLIGGALGAYRQVGQEISDHFAPLVAPDQVINIPNMLDRVGVKSLFILHASMECVRYGVLLEKSTATFRLVAECCDESIWSAAKRVNRKYWLDAERSMRNLSRDMGPFNFEWSSAWDEELFQWVLSRKLAQYERTGKDGAPLFDPILQLVLENMLRSDSDGDRLILSTLRVGGHVIAAHLGIKIDTALHYWFPVYDDQYSRYSPGKILLALMLQSADSDGIRMFDYGEGAAPYKSSTANKFEDLGRAVIVNGLFGFVSTIPKKILWRLNL